MPNNTLIVTVHKYSVFEAADVKRIADVCNHLTHSALTLSKSMGDTLFRQGCTAIQTPAKTYVITHTWYRLLRVYHCVYTLFPCNLKFTFASNEEVPMQDRTRVSKGTRYSISVRTEDDTTYIVFTPVLSTDVWTSWEQLETYTPMNLIPTDANTATVLPNLRPDVSYFTSFEFLYQE